MKSISVAALLMLAMISVLQLGGIAHAEGLVKLMPMLSLYSDGGGVALRDPQAVSCAGFPSLIVADTGNARLLRYSFHDGKPDPAAEPLQFPEVVFPIRIEGNSKGDLYILDGKEHRIYRVPAGGTTIAEMTAPGSPSSGSYVARSMTIDKNDLLYVLDIASNRVLVLTADGQFRKEIPFPRESGFLSDICIGRTGDLLLLDSINARIFRSTPDGTAFQPLTGTLSTYVRFPTSLASDSKGRLYLADRNGSTILILRQDGSYLGRQSGRGSKEGLLYYPSDICVTNDGVIFIADTCNNRIQAFTGAQ